jgi:hypothetical protein
MGGTKWSPGSAGQIARPVGDGQQAFFQAELIDRAVKWSEL